MQMAYNVLNYSYHRALNEGTNKRSTLVTYMQAHPPDKWNMKMVVGKFIPQWMQGHELFECWKGLNQDGVYG
ncbi:unnamed protein product [Sphenostylis stenocarpa]|uniref:Uncharacterized protein n=1 Tax=Sphenostylis stenocarpa TaxID=92480 RepID=A0AA86VKL3_9FABA|nr:unnamed protein product [Sphenostylis stenocarpa]